MSAADGRSSLACERVALRDDGTLRLAAVAETHLKMYPATAERVRAYGPDAILHAGGRRGPRGA
jgi:hypothetical protein